MKTTLLLTSLLVTSLAAGCNPSGEKSALKSTDTAAQQIDKAQAASKAAARQIKNYSFEQRSEFVTAMQAQLDELNRILDETSTKIDNSSTAVQADARPKLSALRDQAKQLDKQLREVINATPSTWDGIKADSEKAYTALKDGLNQSRQWISDKIAP